MLPDVGQLKRTISDDDPEHGEPGERLRPSAEAPDPFASASASVVAPRKMQTPYAAYRKIVLMAVTMTIDDAAAAECPGQERATVNSQAMTTIAVSALAGVRYRRETFLSQPDPGPRHRG